MATATAEPTALYGGRGQLIVLGAAGGAIIPVITSELLGSVDRTRSGVAAVMLNTLRETGSAIGAPSSARCSPGAAASPRACMSHWRSPSDWAAVVAVLAPMLRDRAG